MLGVCSQRQGIEDANASFPTLLFTTIPFDIYSIVMCYEQVDGVYDMHEFHIWQLSGNRIIATAHIRCQNLHDYPRISKQVKSFFHDEGIHSTTIQPEFVEVR